MNNPSGYTPGFLDAFRDARVVVQQHYDHQWYQLGWAAIALSIAIGGIIGLYIIYYICQRCCFPDLFRKRWVSAGPDPKNPKRKKFVKETKRSYRPYIRVGLGTFFIVGVFFTVWIAFNISGFNYVNSGILATGMGLVATYMFGTAIQNFGSGYWVNLEDKIEKGWWVELPQYGPTVKGYVQEKHGLFTELHHLDADGYAVDVQVPYTLALGGIIVRKHKMETKEFRQAIYKSDIQVAFDKKLAVEDTRIDMGGRDSGGGGSGGGGGRMVPAAYKMNGLEPRKMK